MKATWYFLHMLGQVAWIGGALAAMVIGAAAKREEPASLGMVARLQNAVYRLLIGPGAMVTVLSGLLLTLQMYNQVTAVGLSHSLMTMQLVGIIAGVWVLVHTVPNSNKLARLEPVGPTAVAFAAIRKRVVVSGMVSSLLALLGLVTGALYQIR